MIYQLLIRLLAPLIVALILWDAFKRKGGKVFILQRLGLFYPTTRSGAIWIHCASVGEVKAIETLVKSASLSQPNQAWLITTNTPTGYQTAQGLNLPNCELRYCPFDWPFALKRFLRASQPSKLWVVETELWPNLYRLCAQQNIVITLINGRLSRKTLKAPAWLKRQYQQCLNDTTQILARSSVEEARFMALGAAAEKIQVLGNLKRAGLKTQPAFPRPIEREYVLLASSHQGEEADIAQRWLALQRAELLVIVPRHAKRGQALYRQFVALGIAVGLASAPRDKQACQTLAIWIDDSFGQLMPWFAHAKLVIMGGSFVPKGGHNFLEPAAFGKAILTGWDNSDFEDELAEFRQNGAIIVCADYDSLQRRLNQLLINGALREQLGRHAYQTIQNQPDILAAYQHALDIQ
ncbi:MAG: glycosyltransferase N-terminal domain-containing protein [Thiomicrospira sp.]|jgi:3-deoxy-D-manno-octulosonic-acid transferase|nr:glycosyltransferase N-terminal domain-containing protein [Thiomicrospira sp.]